MDAVFIYFLYLIYYNRLGPREPLAYGEKCITSSIKCFAGVTTDHTPYTAVIFLGTQLRGNNNNISNQVDSSIRHRLLLKTTDDYTDDIQYQF